MLPTIKKLFWNIQVVLKSSSKNFNSSARLENKLVKYLKCFEIVS